ncbi:MAG TPA: transglycosylase domain-containing protein [Candidatus Absconditabacterales bacterium]|nr:transglycosylase domain-containing protein [Candidatus Absconditabacterales bacterium]
MKIAKKPVIKFFIRGNILFFIALIASGIKSFSHLDQKPSTKIYDKNGILLADIRAPYRQTAYESLSELPSRLLQFVITKEDQRFYSHPGIDLLAIARAFRVNLNAGKIVQGASTIDQQAIKLSRESFLGRGISEKIREGLGAIGLQFRYSKDEILLFYLNNLSFGNGIRGLKTACKIYFNTDCDQLSKPYLIYLISKSKYPSKSDLADYSYQSMLQNGITGYTLNDFQIVQQNRGLFIEKKIPHLVDYILSTNPTQSNLTTTVDLALYEKIQIILEKMKPYLETQNANDTCILVFDGNKLISMNILQVYGSQGSYINCCLRKRQVGSGMKPFLYTIAFQKFGYTPETIIKDEPVSYFLDNGGKYQPKNFSMHYHGEVSMGQALGSSLNIPAVKLLDQVKVDVFYDFLRTIGKIVGTEEKREDDPSQYGLALALGVKEISPLDFAKMRTIFSYDYTDSVGAKNFLTTYKSARETIKSILSINSNRLLSFPQFNRFDLPDPFVKSGTSRNFVDGRVCGAHKSGKLLCIRVGNYNAQPMKDSGYATAGSLRNEIMILLSSF